jgi:hypothetical protein
MPVIKCALTLPTAAIDSLPPDVDLTHVDELPLVHKLVDSKQELVWDGGSLGMAHGRNVTNFAESRVGVG